MIMRFQVQIKIPMFVSVCVSMFLSICVYMFTSLCVCVLVAVVLLFGSVELSCCVLTLIDSALLSLLILFKVLFTVSYLAWLDFLLFENGVES